MTSGAVHNKGSQSTRADGVTDESSRAFQCLQVEEGFSESLFGSWAPIFINLTEEARDFCEL